MYYQECVLKQYRALREQGQTLLKTSGSGEKTEVTGLLLQVREEKNMQKILNALRHYVFTQFAYNYMTTIYNDAIM